MTGQQLKNSILQLAIQGKLVPQIESEGTAEDLLKEIRAEKERLVKEGKLKKKDLDVKPIEEDEEPFELPSGWRWCRLGEISTYVLSKKKINASEADPQTWGLDLEDIEKGGRLLCIKTVGERGSIGDKTIFSAGDIRYSKVSPYLLKILVAPQNGICTSEIVPFSCYGNIENLYMVNFLKSPYVDEYINSTTFGIKMPRVSTETMNSLLVPLPPLSEQKRIVSKIEELMPLVEEYGKAQERLAALNKELPDKLKKSVLQEAIMGKLVPQDPTEGTAEELLAEIRKEKEKLVKEGKLKKKDLEVKPIEDDEIPFEIPEGWKWCRLGEISNIWSARRVHEKDWRSSGIPFFRAREIGKLASEGTVDNELFIDKELYDEFSKSGLPQANDLMLTAVGTLGKAYIVKESDVFYYKDGSVLCLNNFGHLNPIFFKYAIESSMFVKQYQNESEGTTVSTLTIVRMNGYMLPIPPLAEQKRIVAKLEEVMEEIEGMKK